MRHQESTCTEGNSLKPYKLTLFNTATTQDRRHYKYIKEVIESNEDKAIDKECGYINGRLYYGFYQFKPNEKGRYRYIFYRNSSLREDEPCEKTSLARRRALRDNGSLHGGIPHSCRTKKNVPEMKRVVTDLYI